MDTRYKFFEDIQRRVDAVIGATPAADLRKNLKAMLAQQFARVDLVTTEDLDAQRRVLARSREKLEELEKRLREMEAARKQAK